MTYLYAFLTVFAWGLWLAPSQTVRFGSEYARTFYVALANVLLAASFFFFRPYDTSIASFLVSFVCGAFWVLGAVSAFTATRELGIAKAMGIWSPLNVCVSVFWGIAIWGEIVDQSHPVILLALLGIAVIAGGIRLIVLSEKRVNLGGHRPKNLMPAVLAGVFWGSYFIPMRLAEVSPWTALFPMSLGMFSGAILLNVRNPRGLIIQSGRKGYILAVLSGLLWGLGNFSSLRLMELAGTGVGFTLAQLCVIVNALAGIYLFKKPEPRSSAARRVLLGCGLALVGGIALFLAR